MKQVMLIAFPEHIDLVGLEWVGIVGLYIVAAVAVVVVGRDVGELNRERQRIDRSLEVELIVGLHGRYEVVYSCLVA